MHYTPVNELMVLYNMKSTKEKFAQKTKTRKQPSKKTRCIICTYNQQLKGNNSAQLTRTQHLNSNNPNHTH